jgi:hypothetical protein
MGGKLGAFGFAFEYFPKLASRAGSCSPTMSLLYRTELQPKSMTSGYNFEQILVKIQKITTFDKILEILNKFGLKFKK